eukprot:764405-Hanusia_phi.AAC.1
MIYARYADNYFSSRWSPHSSDWIYQGGPSMTFHDIHDPTYNQWDNLDATPASWNVSQPVDSLSVDKWLSDVVGVY